MPKSCRDCKLCLMTAFRAIALWGQSRATQQSCRTAPTFSEPIGTILHPAVIRRAAPTARAAGRSEGAVTAAISHHHKTDPDAEQHLVLMVVTQKCSPHPIPRGSREPGRVWDGDSLDRWARRAPGPVGGGCCPLGLAKDPAAPLLHRAQLLGWGTCSGVPSAESFWLCVRLDEALPLSCCFTSSFVFVSPSPVPGTHLAFPSGNFLSVQLHRISPSCSAPVWWKPALNPGWDVPSAPACRTWLV